MHHEDLRNRFEYHPPSTEEIAEAHEQIRKSCYVLALHIERLVPDSREKSLAITKLEEVMYWANAGITRRQEVGSASPTDRPRPPQPPPWTGPPPQG